MGGAADAAGTIPPGEEVADALDHLIECYAVVL
jgi:hypothetical protein